MKPPSRMLAANVAAILAVSACATGPVTYPDPGQVPERRVLRVTTFHMARDPNFLSSTPYRVQMYPLENATCTASNERGTWVLQAPGRLEFQTADKSMRIECRKEGYRDAVVELGCLKPPATPGEGASRGAAAGAILSLPATVGPAIFYGPGLVLAVIAGAAALGSIVGIASVKPEGTACSLANVKAGELQVYLEPVR